jgi:hypothetical protein
MSVTGFAKTGIGFTGVALLGCLAWFYLPRNAGSSGNTKLDSKDAETAKVPALAPAEASKWDARTRKAPAPGAAQPYQPPPVSDPR